MPLFGKALRRPFRALREAGLILSVYCVRVAVFLAGRCCPCAWCCRRRPPRWRFSPRRPTENSASLNGLSTESQRNLTRWEIRASLHPGPRARRLDGIFDGDLTRRTLMRVSRRVVCPESRAARLEEAEVRTLPRRARVRRDLIVGPASRYGSLTAVSK